VPMPSLGGAMLMMFLSFVLTFVVLFALVWAATALALSIQLNPSELMLYSGLGSTVLYFVVLSILLALFLPAPIFRTFIIAVLCVPVGILLCVLFFGLLWLASTVFNFTFPAFEHLRTAR